MEAGPPSKRARELPDHPSHVFHPYKHLQKRYTIILSYDVTADSGVNVPKAWYDLNVPFECDGVDVEVIGSVGMDVEAAVTASEATAATATLTTQQTAAEDTAATYSTIEATGDAVGDATEKMSNALGAALVSVSNSVNGTQVICADAETKTMKSAGDSIATTLVSVSNSINGTQVIAADAIASTITNSFNDTNLYNNEIVAVLCPELLALAGHSTGQPLVQFKNGMRGQASYDFARPSDITSQRISLTAANQNAACVEGAVFRPNYTRVFAASVEVAFSLALTFRRAQ